MIRHDSKNHTYFIFKENIMSNGVDENAMYRLGANLGKAAKESHHDDYSEQMRANERDD